jgi:hypothetical protein
MPNGEQNEEPRNGEYDPNTKLYIRTNPADDGSEPLPTALKHWKSPDITIIKPDGTRGTEAVANQLNQVEVMVTNGGGGMANNAFVDVFFADPSTAFTPATATSIGNGYVTLPGYSMGTLTLPWTPASADAGHRCLLARVSLLVPPDTYANGAIFDVRGDRHVAQRNIHVLVLASEQKSLSFSFALVNPLLEPMQMRVVAREVRDARTLANLGRSLGCDFAQFGETPLPAVKVDLGRERLEVPQLENPLDLIGQEFRLSRAGPIDLTALEKPRNSMTVNMEPGEVREAIVYIERNPDTRAGDLHAIEVIQYDSHRQTVGGLTLIVQH